MYQHVYISTMVSNLNTTPPNNKTSSHKAYMFVKLKVFNKKIIQFFCHSEVLARPNLK